MIYTVTIVEQYRKDIEVEASSRADAEAGYPSRGNIKESEKLGDHIIACTAKGGEAPAEQADA